jgi:hypothetical protein
LCTSVESDAGVCWFIATVTKVVSTFVRFRAPLHQSLWNFESIERFEEVQALLVTEVIADQDKFADFLVNAQLDDVVKGV